MRTFRFYCETCPIEGTRYWFIDLKWWPFGKHWLAMVAGADTLLEKLAEGKKEVFLEVSTKAPADPAFDMLHRKMTMSWFGGAVYSPVQNKIKTEIFGGQNLLWLCPVTLFVFLRYPERIFFKCKK